MTITKARPHRRKPIVHEGLNGYERPAVTVDVLIFTVLQEKLQIALIQRGLPPYEGEWALPGGFVRADESLDEAARREIAEEAGVTDTFLEQLYTFGDPERDPRGRVITVAYFALVPGEKLVLRAETDAAAVQWFPVHAVPALAFDHAEILAAAVNRLKAKLEYANIAFALLPASFSLSELQRVYEIILGRSIDKRNFRKRILSLGFIEPTGKYSAGAHRPAQLYRWKKHRAAPFA